MAGEEDNVRAFPGVGAALGAKIAEAAIGALERMGQPGPSLPDAGDFDRRSLWRQVFNYATSTVQNGMIAPIDDAMIAEASRLADLAVAKYDARFPASAAPAAEATP